MRKTAILFFILFVVFSCKDKLDRNESIRDLRFASGMGGSLSIGFRSLEENSFEIELVDDDEIFVYEVGIFHTHPPLILCAPFVYRVSGASEDDEKYATNMPSLVADYDYHTYSRVYGGHEPDLQYCIDRVGPERRYDN